MLVDAQLVLTAAEAEGFELAGLTPALPHPDYSRYRSWIERGNAQEMRYLADHRALVREDPRQLLPTARTMLCAGKLYNTPGPKSHGDVKQGWISRYAWGSRDYHDVLREGLERVAASLRESIGAPFEHRVCVDTAPLLERSYAREAGLGWIGRNKCLINEPRGSWFFLGEMLLSFEVNGYASPPPDRCGTCTRCIDACPTTAIVPGDGGWEIETAKCISYWTIEAKTQAPDALKQAFGNHIFGCDICQDVCPWNSRAPLSAEQAFQPLSEEQPLEELSPENFRARFGKTSVARSKPDGFNRNVRVALENHRE